MAKSTIHHDRDGVAIDALRRVLPTYWIYKDPANIFGGKEYSEDLIIEIVNDDARRTVSGVEFGVQNKTDLKIRKRHVTVKLGIDDITRLMSLQRPVLIHGYDLKTRTSYWLWLNEWYPTHTSKLKGKKAIAVDIPKKNVLDVRAVTKIEQYARWEHHKQKRKEHAEMVARQYANDYNVHVGIGKMEITTVFDPKHEKAIPTIHALDQSASDAMIQAIETGEIVPLVGSIAFSNVPELMLEKMHETIEAAWLVPYVPENPISVLKIELLNETDKVVLKSPFVELRQVKLGTVIKRLEGTDADLGITYSFTFDGRANTTTYNVHFQPSISNARALRYYFDRLNLLRTVTKLRITNLKTEGIIERDGFDLFNRKPTFQEEVCEKMALALVTIEDRLNVTFEIPKTVDGSLLGRVEWIAEALRDGFVKVNNVDFIPDDSVLICGDPANIARKMLTDFEEHGQLSIIALGSANEMEVELLNHTLHLGLAWYAFANTKIINAEELRNVFSQEDITDDTSVQTVFEIDRNEIYLRFDKWFPKTEVN
ncbi:MAG: DUF4365 domain-containing protein [Anaerolineae bacterium]|nr:DUF4365 domain-containing protein [Anaerolineae bacterium]